MGYEFYNPWTEFDDSGVANRFFKKNRQSWNLSIGSGYYGKWNHTIHPVQQVNPIIASVISKKEQIIIVDSNDPHSEYKKFDYQHTMLGFSPKLGFIKESAVLNSIANGIIVKNKNCDTQRRAAFYEADKIRERKQIFGKGDDFLVAIERIYKVYQGLYE
jgi:hypothetical protein